MEEKILKIEFTGESPPQGEQEEPLSLWNRLNEQAEKLLSIFTEKLASGAKVQINVPAPEMPALPAGESVPAPSGQKLLPPPENYRPPKQLPAPSPSPSRALVPVSSKPPSGALVAPRPSGGALVPAAAAASAGARGVPTVATGAAGAGGGAAGGGAAAAAGGAAVPPLAAIVAAAGALVLLFYTAKKLSEVFDHLSEQWESVGPRTAAARGVQEAELIQHAILREPNTAPIIEGQTEFFKAIIEFKAELIRFLSPYMIAFFVIGTAILKIITFLMSIVITIEYWLEYIIWYVVDQLARVPILGRYFRDIADYLKRKLDALSPTGDTDPFMKEAEEFLASTGKFAPGGDEHPFDEKEYRVRPRVR